MKNKLKNRINKWLDGSMRNNSLNRWLIGIVYGDNDRFLAIIFLGFILGTTFYNGQKVGDIERNIIKLVETANGIDYSTSSLERNSAPASSFYVDELYQYVSKLLDSDGDGMTTEDDWKRGYKLINVHYDEKNPVELSYGNLNDISAHLHNLE